MINPQWLELLMSRTIFYGPKDVRAIEVRLYVNTESRSKLLGGVGYAASLCPQLRRSRGGGAYWFGLVRPSVCPLCFYVLVKLENGFCWELEILFMAWAQKKKKKKKNKRTRIFSIGPSMAELCHFVDSTITAIENVNMMSIEALELRFLYLAYSLGLVCRRPE